MYEQGQIKNRLACIKLNEIDEESEMIIGGCDVEAEYWVPVADTGFWQVNLTKLEVKTPDGEVKATFCEQHGPCIAIFDTGADDISKMRKKSLKMCKTAIILICNGFQILMC